MTDNINHPPHYTSHPSGVECVDIAEHLSFNLGNALKYVWRAGKKDPEKRQEDLDKARWYIDREERHLEVVQSHEIIQPGSEGVVRYLARKVVDQEQAWRNGASLVEAMVHQIMLLTNEVEPSSRQEVVKAIRKALEAEASR